MSEVQLEPMKVSRKNMDKVTARRQAEEDRIMEVAREIKRREAAGEYQPPRPFGRRTAVMGVLEGGRRIRA
ncbi:MAG: hypothetical protein ACYDGR_09855 [Candidatus Dormibacteria bacterium]